MRKTYRDNNRIYTAAGRLKAIRLAALALIAGVCMTGCGIVDMPELTDEQTELVTEYAAGLMLKYDISYAGDSLLDPETLARQEAKEAQIRERERAAKAAAEDYLAKKANAGKDKSTDKEASPSDSSGSGSTANSEQSVGDLADFYGIDGFDISYTGYELTDSYPDSGEDMLMAMDATAGNTLCVVKFNVTNNSGSDAMFDMFYRNPNFYLSVNGGDRVHQQYTLLLDDMAASNDSFAAGQTMERVLIFEVPDSVGSISSLSMQVKNADGDKGVMNLQ